jgi:1,4-dihydroxy-2-naphthoate octaprenyltransferase
MMWLAVLAAYWAVAFVTARRAMVWAAPPYTAGVWIVAVTVGTFWPLWWLFLLAMTAAAAIAKAVGSGEQS